MIGRQGEGAFDTVADVIRKDRDRALAARRTGPPALAVAVAVPAVVPAPRFRTSANADLIAIYLAGLATVALLAIPFIPGLRDIPRWIPVHRLIWRNWNQQSAGPVGQPEPGPKPEPAGQK